MRKESFSQGDVIFNENDQGDKFYFIYSGRVRISINNSKVRDLDSGNCFGEYSLIKDEKRTATVTALEKLNAIPL